MQEPATGGCCLPMVDPQPLATGYRPAILSGPLAVPLKAACRDPHDVGVGHLAQIYVGVDTVLDRPVACTEGHTTSTREHP